MGEQQMNPATLHNRLFLSTSQVHIQRKVELTHLTVHSPHRVLTPLRIKTCTLHKVPTPNRVHTLHKVPLLTTQTSLLPTQALQHRDIKITKLSNLLSTLICDYHLFVICIFVMSGFTNI